MLSKQFKRCLSFMMALVMVLSLTPVTALATKTEEPAEPEVSTDVSELTPTETEEVTPAESSAPVDEEAEKPTESSEPATEPETVSSVEELQARINAILTQYDISAEMTDEEIANAIAAADSETIKATMDEMDALETDAQSLTEEEIMALDTDLYGRFCNVFELLFCPMPIATTVNVLDGKVTVTDSSGNGTVSNGTVTIKAAGSLFSKATNTITITNNSGSAATLSFDYSVSYSSAFTIDNATAETSGNFSKVLANGASTVFVVTSNSGWSNTTATLTLNNFNLVAAAASSNVTFQYNSTLGSITVGGTAVAAGGVAEVSSSGAEVVATPVSGAVFLGWIDADHKVISSNATHTLLAASDMTVTAVFASAGTDAWFSAGGGTYLYDDLNAATNYASSASSKTVVLAANGTLPAGDYTIPSGVKFLIPYKADDTGMFVDPTADNGYLNETAGTISVFRTMTMAEGANITVYGYMNVNAQQYVSGDPSTNKIANGFGCIKMNSGSSITVANGGTLYCYGYIWGDGTVEATSGAKVFERLEVRDWRGGTVTTEWKGNYDCFVVSQYYAQNIETEYIINNGARSYVTIGIKASLTKQVSNPIFIGASGDNALFNLTSGKITRTYDGKNDRMTYDVSGDLTLNNLSITIQSFTSIDSKDYIFPVNNALTINMNSGNLTIKYPVKLLPGSQINIEKDATATIESTGALYIYDAADIRGTTSDGTSKIYYYNGIQGVNYSPTRSSVGGKRASTYASAQLVINGTLTANGPIYTSEQAGTDVNKVIKGTGTFNNNCSSYSASVAIDELWQDSWSTTYGALSVNCVPVVAHLAGINADTTTYNSVSTGIYHGLSTNYWYQWKVNTTGVDANGNAVDVDPVSITGDTDGYIVNGGTFTVTVPDGYELTAVSTSSGTLTESSGTYTLTSATEDVTITVTLKCNHTKTTVENHVDATCDKAGYTGDTVCSDCGETIEIGTTSDALGHSYETVVTAPTCTEAGYTTYTCSACGDSYVDDEVAANGHTWSGTKCTVCGLFKLYATSLRAGDYLDMYFYVKASDLTEGQNYYAHVEKTFADGRDSVTRDIYYLNVDGTQNWETYQNDYLRFSFDDISAKEMTDEIHVTIYDASGNPVSTTTTETIQSYAVRLLSGLTGDGLSQKNQYLRTSLIDMLNYGAAAQDKFSYNTGDLATYGCDAYQEYATAEVTCDAGETDTSKGLDSASVIADNGLTLCLFFDNLNDADLTSLTASVSYTNHYGNAVSWTTSEFNTTNEGLVGVDIVGLAIADGRQLITCEVTNSANEVVASGTYSIERYLASNLEAHDVFSNLMKFIVSAYDYFHS